MAQKETFYGNVVCVTYDYLGPAAGRFVDRQILNHLNKRPEELAKADLRELIDWIKIAMTVLTDDDDLVKEYIHNLRRLAKVK